MKKLLLSLCVVLLTVSLFAQKKLTDVVKLDNDVINMGQIKQGNPTPAKFIVTNIGAEPLIIEQASPTCGCTISDYTKEPIMPGKTGYINATYNAASVGHFDKHLTVKFAGVDEVKTITLSGDVVDAGQTQIVKTDEVVKPGLSATPVAVKTTTKTTTIKKKTVKKPVKKTTTTTTVKTK